MGVGVELSEQATVTSKKAWLYARDAAVNAARIMLEQDVDKSRINRVLEPYLWLHDIVTFTEYENTLALRCPPGDQATIDFPAQLEYQELALLVRGSLQTSVPQQVDQGWWPGDRGVQACQRPSRRSRLLRQAHGHRAVGGVDHQGEHAAAVSPLLAVRDGGSTIHAR
jgi:hypothetical protein